MGSNARTDLAVEEIFRTNINEGITQTIRGKVFKITEIIINEDKYGEPIGKKKGRYVTLENEMLGKPSSSYKLMAEELAEELRKFLPKGQILVVGLGNHDITPDALGPEVAEKVLATRHLKEEMKDDYISMKLREVSVLAAGVLGQTGIETAEIIKSICGKIPFNGIVVIDAFACSDISRLATTIQISDSGISPGSGVNNKRKEISLQTIGIPVIALGVPTVVDMHTIVESITGEDIGRDVPNMMVTPRDIDRLIQKSAKLIACSINLALQSNMTFDDIESLA